MEFDRILMVGRSGQKSQNAPVLERVDDVEVGVGDDARLARIGVLEERDVVVDRGLSLRRGKQIG